MELDLVICRGTIIDGSGQPGYPADVGIQSGRIAAIAGPGALRARREADARREQVAARARVAPVDPHRP